jgi:hypothetical protein
MKKIACLVVLAMVLLATVNTRAEAEENLPEKLQELTNEAYRAYSARETSETIHRAVEEFVGSAEPSDDLTKMCIKMK